MVIFLLVVLLISFLILVHEWGHFYVARILKVRVEEFGFGFPPKIFSRVKNGVRYSFNLLPFGGFVKIFGEHGEGEEDQESFIARPPSQRFLILAAGILMNFVLAWIFFTIAIGVGIPQIVDGAKGIPVAIVGVLPYSPADRSGLKFGDEILEIRSTSRSVRIETEEDVREFVNKEQGKEVTLSIRRGVEIMEIRAVPRSEFPEGEGPLGIALARLALKKTPWFLAPYEGVKVLARSTIAVTEGLAFILKELLVEGKTSVQVSGPVGIFLFAADSRTLGIAYFLQFIGVLSVNLAVLNFLPIPALDGGRILFLGIEKVRGRRIDPRIENTVHTFGFLFLVFLMVLVTYKDIARVL